MLKVVPFALVAVKIAVDVPAAATSHVGGARVTVIAYVLVEPFSAVTTMFLVDTPIATEIAADAVPEAVLLPSTEIVAPEYVLVGVAVMELAELGTDKLYEVVADANVCSNRPSEKVSPESVVSPDRATEKPILGEVAPAKVAPSLTEAVNVQVPAATNATSPDEELIVQTKGVVLA